MSGPHIEIQYCPRCKWLLRAGWYAQELLSTFGDELKAVTLSPSEVAGRFDLLLDGEIIFSRKVEGRFPEAKEVKRLVRDQVAPDRDLGHIDTERDESGIIRN